MKTLHTFPSLHAAREYRHTHGTGGWIFAPDDGGESVLFPPDMPPSAIFRHPITRGRDGRLIGAQ